MDEVAPDEVGTVAPDEDGIVAPGVALDEEGTVADEEGTVADEEGWGSRRDGECIAIVLLLGFGGVVGKVTPI